MIAGTVAAGFIALALTYGLFHRFTRPSLSRIRGPKSSSFILGNLLELFQRPVGEADFEWQRLYGDVVRFKTVFGGDQLLVADPKALNTMFNTSAYRFLKQPDLLAVALLVTGKGLIWADGETHARQRKILLPGFGVAETKAFLNIFQGCAESMTTKWTEIISTNSNQKVVMDMMVWLSRATLDAIGQAAFNVQLGAIHNDGHPLARQYYSMMSDAFGRPSAQSIFILAASMYAPTWVLEWLMEHGPSPRLERVRKMNRIITEMARDLVEEKAKSLLEGKGSRDIFSLLVKANMDPDAKNRLTEEELFAQMRTLMFAGQETTTNTLGWIIFELAQHPEMQSRLHSEIRQMEATIQARGETQFTMTDFDAMPYTTAVIKEGLRYHPAAHHINRVASTDDVLPLSRPIVTETGELIDELVIPKGTKIVISIAAYNHNKDLWGADAHEFNPDRWLDGIASEKKATSVGVYSNLMTFSSGHRSCLGSRFALIEIQAFLVEMVGMFEFSMTDKARRIHREPSLVMTPMIDGESDSQIPLLVSVAARK